MSNRTVSDAVHLVVALLAIPVVTAWNALVTCREEDLPRADDPLAETAIVEHERGWIAYLRGFHLDNGENVTESRLREGLRLWVESSFLRGYTVGDDVYLCPMTPRSVRVHQAGHAPAFGEVFEPIAAPYRDDGGLPDEPLGTLDVMLPGDLPHTFLRLTDRRGLAGAYRAWYHDGRIERVREGATDLDSPTERPVS